MRRRWVWNDPSPQPPTVGWSVVASWWPGTYYTVLTERREESPMLRLTRSLEQGVAYADATIGESYLTMVWKGDRNGFVKTPRHTIWSREYTSLRLALASHQEIVKLLLEGHPGLRTGLGGRLEANEVET